MKGIERGDVLELGRLSVAGTGVSTGEGLEDLITGLGKPNCERGRGAEAPGRCVLCVCVCVCVCVREREREGEGERGT